ncbi:MAG: DUF4366 domain-containing protein [Acutalibacteraceae bacterium]|nr:DUF4366 domain-containing protein [Acutalibacteraceae bacterium]MEE0859359.1 DUF4366 domain-containing protein [Acutalibacteraceae bacterium]MEE1155737.1 DUF4366 domain-containing protein [Acutalibacteraceae bacterium]
MKNINKIKKKSIIALAMALTLIFSSIVSVSATETATAVASSSSSESKTNDEDREDSEDDEKDKESATEESTEKKDYTFSTTTKGNSELVANQEVLLENGYHQFIAVETRDGDIFYIIIDKTKTEDNVYFLNEVDTYDINKLMSDDESGSGTNNTTASTTEDKETEPTETPTATQKPTASSGNSQFTLILVVGICLLGGIGFAIFKLSKGKKKPVQQDDFFDEDDDEINEDEEGNI